MGDGVPSIGIDFGTTNSSMAWYDPRSGRAEVIKNQGEDKTPSMVYFGEDETLVGKPVDELIEDVSNDRARREEVFRRTIVSIKRNLIAPPRIALPEGRYVRPVEVVAEILKNLKREAQERHFHEEVGRAVITCPAEFNVIQRRKIEEGGRLVGFEEVVLIEEPAAAALAYARAGLDVGRYVLVYDLGGGTFDLAVLENEEGSFRVAMEPKGIDRCGGDDFDLALYYHCEEIARERQGRPISLNGAVDLKFLRLCRSRKESLSWRERVRFGNYLAADDGPVYFEHEVDRETFEGLIAPYVEETLLLTRRMLEEAGASGFEPDTTVLIGGSTRVPLVERRLVETLPVAPLKFDKAEVAVALGAACHAERLWPSSRPKPATSARSAPMVESEITREVEKEARRRREAEARTAEDQGRREEEEDEHGRRVVEEDDLPDAAFAETVRSEARTPSTVVEVPDLSGLNRSETKSALTEVGLNFGVQTKAPSDTVTKGRITKQEPAAGTRVKRGSYVSVTFSSGPEEPITTGERVPIHKPQPERTGASSSRSQLQDERTLRSEPERDRRKPMEVFGAVAAVVAGVAWMAAGLLPYLLILYFLRTSYSLNHLLSIVALIGTLGGLVGLNARQRVSYRRLGMVGFLSAFVWTALLAVVVGRGGEVIGAVVGGVEATVVAGVGRIVVGRVDPVVVKVGAVGVGVIDVGLALMGIATLRAVVLPRWCGWLLIIGAYGSFFFGGLVLGPVWLALGYALWSQRGISAEQPDV